MVRNFNLVVHIVTVVLRSAKEKNMSLCYRLSVSTDQFAGQLFPSAYTVFLLIFFLRLDKDQRSIF